MSFKHLKNKVLGSLPVICPIGSIVRYEDGIWHTIIKHIFCDRTKCRASCTVDGMRALDDLGNGWCLDTSELPKFTIKRSR